MAVYLLLVLVAMELTGLYLWASLRSYYLNSIRLSLTAHAQLLGGMVAGYLARPEGPDREAVANLAAGWPAETGFAVAILDAGGVVLGASRSQADLVGKRLQTDEVSNALGGSRGSSVGTDPRSGEPVYVVAEPVMDSGRVVGVVYLQGSLAPAYEVLRNIRRILLWATGAALVLTVVLGSGLARTITRPIEEVTRKAALMARGDFDQAIPVRSGDEIGQLAEMFNYLAGRLKETLAAISDERNKLETIMAFMADGIVAVDRGGRVIRVNQAACRMLGVTPESSLGREHHELWPNTGLALAVQAVLDQGQTASLQVHLPGQDRVLQAHITPLRERGSLGGAVVVLHDITELQRVEAMRREFVANVSHELKTPLTTVKSYVETLLDGAAEDPDLRQRFLRVVESETDRMVRLVRDLLHLSQLDQGTVRWDIQPYDLPSLVEEALAKLEVTAQRKRLQIHREWPRDLPPVLVDRDKLLQVLLNILANAIEFTPEGGAITVRVGAAEALFPAAVPAGAAGPAAAQGPAGVATAGGARAEAPEPAQEAGRYLAVQVQDTGIGIPKDDLPRIFERFYRVDKARSRTLGGTGLGMAIAKQIVEALGGRIGIDSELGKGTVVTFTVPVALAGDGSGWDGDEAALPEGVGP